MIKRTTIAALFILILYAPVKAQNTEIFGFFGPSYFLGDLGGKPFRGTNDFTDLDMLSTRYSAGGGIRFNFGRVISLRAEGFYARVSGNDKYTTNRERRGRNLSFFSPIVEGDLMAEIHFGQRKGKTGHFYVMGGIGYFYFNPKTKYNGKKYALKQFNTEGQNFLPGRSPYSLSALAFPFGIGYKWSVSKWTSFSVELNTRKSTTDYIDDVSTFYVDKAQMIANNGQLAANLADRNISDIPGFSSAGAIRGDSKDKDSFFLFTFSVNKIIGGKPGSGFGGGKRSRYRHGGRGKCFEL